MITKAFLYNYEYAFVPELYLTEIKYVPMQLILRNILLIVYYYSRYLLQPQGDDYV